MKTRDGIYLRGLAIQAKAQPTSKALLILMGNVAIADRFVQYVSDLTDSGYDIFLYDYRGYGRSDGAPRFRALIDDVVEIVEDLKGNRGYAHVRVYGASLGSFIALNAASESIKIDSIFVDSVLSRTSTTFGCRSEYEPVSVLGSICTVTWTLIGRRDTEFAFEGSREFRERLVSCGGHLEVRDNLGHPFQDGPPELSEERRALIRSWLAAPMPARAR